MRPHGHRPHAVVVEHTVRLGAETHLLEGAVAVAVIVVGQIGVARIARRDRHPQRHALGPARDGHDLDARRDVVHGHREVRDRAELTAGLRQPAGILHAVGRAIEPRRADARPGAPVDRRHDAAGAAPDVGQPHEEGIDRAGRDLDRLALVEIDVRDRGLEAIGRDREARRALLAERAVAAAVGVGLAGPAAVVTHLDLQDARVAHLPVCGQREVHHRARGLEGAVAVQIPPDAGDVVPRGADVGLIVLVGVVAARRVEVHDAAHLRGVGPVLAARVRAHHRRVVDERHPHLDRLVVDRRAPARVLDLQRHGVVLDLAEGDVRGVDVGRARVAVGRHEVPDDLVQLDHAAAVHVIGGLVDEVPAVGGDLRGRVGAVGAAMDEGDGVARAGEHRLGGGDSDRRRLEDGGDEHQHRQAMRHRRVTRVGGHPVVVVVEATVRVLGREQEVGHAAVPVQAGVADGHEGRVIGPHALRHLEHRVIITDHGVAPAVAGGGVVEVPGDEVDREAHQGLGVGIAIERVAHGREHRARARRAGAALVMGPVAEAAVVGHVRATRVRPVRALKDSVLDPLRRLHLAIVLGREQADGRPADLRGVDRPGVGAVVPTARDATVVGDVALAPEEVLGGVLHHVAHAAPCDLGDRADVRRDDQVEVSVARDGLEGGPLGVVLLAREAQHIAVAVHVRVLARLDGRRRPSHVDEQVVDHPLHIFDEGIDLAVDAGPVPAVHEPLRQRAGLGLPVPVGPPRRRDARQVPVAQPQAVADRAVDPLRARGIGVGADEEVAPHRLAGRAAACLDARRVVARLADRGVGVLDAQVVLARRVGPARVEGAVAVEVPAELHGVGAGAARDRLHPGPLARHRVVRHLRRRAHPRHRDYPERVLLGLRGERSED